MVMSVSEIAHLREKYQELQSLLQENAASFDSSKEAIVQYCIDHDIRLYNIQQLKDADAISLLEELASCFTKPANAEKDKNKADWVNKFQEAMKTINPGLVELHKSAPPTLGAAYIQKQTIAVNSLLTQQDMADLFKAPEYRSEDILTSTPFSLTEISAEQLNRIQETLNKEGNEGKEVFLPAVHDGHWFYLHRKEGTWSVQDSQPVLNSTFTPRQESIFVESQTFLSNLHNKQDYGELVYETTGKQTTNYDCGTHVVNAYRSLISEDYQKESHREIMEEVLHIQLPEVDSFNISEVQEYPKKDKLARKTDAIELDKVKELIEVNVSSQTDSNKAGLYRENLQKLIHAVVDQGLFSKVDKPIALDKIDTAKADSEESDEDFATRLQEAEFRNAGLKK